MSLLEQEAFNCALEQNLTLISPVHDAAQRGQLERLQELLTNSTEYNKNSQDTAGNSLLHWAAGAGREEVMKWLISEGCQLNPTNNLGDTPLHRAVWRNQLGAVQVLIAAGADLIPSNATGKRPTDLVRQDDIGRTLHDAIAISDANGDLLYDSDEDGSVSSDAEFE